MLIKTGFLIFLGIASGLAISAGVFAFIVNIGVVPRMAGKSNTASQVYAYQTSIFFGGMIGNIFSLFPVELHVGSIVGILYGLSAGMFTGCLAIALAEILDAFPIMFRRVRLKTGLYQIMMAMAFGKLFGSLHYFYQKMGL